MTRQMSSPASEIGIALPFDQSPEYLYFFLEDLLEDFDVSDTGIELSFFQVPAYLWLFGQVHDDNVSSTAMAAGFAQQEEAALARGGCGSDQNYPWDGIVLLVETISFDLHEKVADFMIEYKRLTTDTTCAEGSRRRELVNKTKWDEWQYLISDDVNSWGGDEDLSNTNPSEAKKWEKFWAFLAQLTATSFIYDGSPPPEIPETPGAGVVDGWQLYFDRTYHALFCFRFAFRTPWHSQFWRWEEANEYEHVVRCSCWWLIRASNHLWYNVKTERRFRATAKQAMPEYHFGQWRSWEAGLQSALTDERYSDDTRDLSRRALVEMDKYDAEDVIPEVGGK